MQFKKKCQTPDIDVFDVTHIEPESRIENEIRSTGVVVYEK